MTPSAPTVAYRLLSTALFFFWVAHAFVLSIKHRNFDFLWHRLGFYRHSKQASVWIHAASVGEVELIKPLALHLSQRQPVIVTTFTPTGFQHARKSLPPQIQVKALPIDFLPTSWLFINLHHFKLGLIAETELWPETLYQARKKNIPLVQINARLSAKSLHTPAWIKSILQQTLGYFDRHLTRHSQDQKNLQSMGVDNNRIINCGNLKFAHPLSAQSHDNLIGRPYILFASTHEPEEQLFAGLVKQLSLDQLAVIAPRHPARAEQIRRALTPLKLALSQRSHNDAITDQTRLYLADTLGELKALIAHAELVIMGGSFNNTGGHNVLEPASLAKPVITGPSDDNIRQDIALLSEQDGIIQVNDIHALGETIKQLLQQPPKRRQMGDNARLVMEQQAHVLDKYVKIIESYL